MYDSFKLIEKIYYVRTSGSEAELKAAQTIREEAEKLGVKARLESFSVDGCEILRSELKFINPEITVDFVGVGMSGNTDRDGIEGEFSYVTSPEDAEMQDLDGKVVMVTGKMVANDLYKVLAAKKPAALILCTGDVYRESEDVDLDPYKYRERHYSLAKIPAVCILMRDAERILREMPERVFVNLQQKEFRTDSHNVIAEIRGRGKTEEVVVFTAHFDSVAYSKGAYDNATGSACILELLGYFRKHRPKRTVRFVWCGSEEDGLLGSRAYLKKHGKDLEKIVFNINVDMVAATIGRDIAVCTADESLVHYIQYLSKLQGFPISVKQGVYSSDSTPFADKGIPSMSFARIAPAGGAAIHSRRDVIERLSEANYYRTCEFIESFSDSLINSAVFPVKREIPEKMKEELDYYNLRKERK